MEHIHVYQKGKQGAPTFVLLHGTGGNEHDLLPIAKMIDESASVLGIRGNVLENGMPRFFKRLAEGVFDMEDLKKRTDELYQFIRSAVKTYQIDENQLFVIGYSNGANVAANMIYEYGNVFKGAILFHAMVPQKEKAIPTSDMTAVFIGAGKHDAMIPAEETKTLIEDLKAAGASVESYWTEGGHQLIREEIDAATAWYNKTK